MSELADNVGDMRFLHTSDWHLGRGFHGYSLRAEQEEMLDTVCQTVQEQQVDVVLISGDVYDRALPPEWAVTALEDCLTRLVALGAKVIITSGNHDSAARLGFARGLMASSGVHIRSSLEDAWQPIELADETGPVLVYGVPYLEPQLYAAQLGCARANHTAVMEAVIGRIREDLNQRDDDGARVILMAHLFAAKGTASDSERHIGVDVPAGESPEHHAESIGGLSVVPLEIFDGFDAVTLGHLHGRQQLKPSVRYSGSPLTYSFSESEQAKGAWLLETGTAERISATALDWQIGRPVKKLRGNIAEMLADETLAQWADAYVQVRLTDPERPERAHQRIKEAYPYLAVFSYEGAGRVRSSSTYSHKVESASNDVDTVAAFLEHVRDRSADADEVELISQAFQEVRAGEAA